MAEHEANGDATHPEHEGEPSAEPSKAESEAKTDTGHVCNVALCPIGLALTAVQPLKPDVVEHLLVAGREFFLAAKALMDVRADDLKGDGGSSTFEKIDIG